MKIRISLFLLLSLCVYNLMAQAYQPLVKKGLKWECALIIAPIWDKADADTVLYHLEFKGDTIIEDNLYSKLHYVFENQNVDDGNTVCAYLRDDSLSRRVYAMANVNFKFESPYGDMFYEMPADKPFLLYDFADMTNPEQFYLKSEIISYGDTAIYEFSYIDVGPYKNVWSREIKDQYTFIESVGFIGESYHPYSTLRQGDMFTWRPAGYVGTCDYIPIFLQLVDSEGNIYFKNQDLISGIESITAKNDKTLEVARYDLSGRRLSQPTQGVNIIKMSDGSVCKQIK